MSSTFNKTDYQIAITVDGETIDASLVYPFHQKDPFPGGHLYTLRIAGPKLHKLFTGISAGVHEYPEVSLSQSVFTELGLFLSRISGQTSGGSKFFLNSIHEMSFTSEELRLTGECSDVVK